MSRSTLKVVDLDLVMTKTIITGQGEIARRLGQEIHLTSEGVVGKGEVLPLPPWSKSSSTETKEELRIIQLDPEEYLSNLLSFSPEVQAGIGSALWTQRATVSGEPLWSILGGETDRIFVNALIGGGKEGELRTSIKEALEQQYGTLKVKMGFPEDRRRLEVIANEISPETRVRLDANGVWTQQEAIDLTGEAHKLFGERLEYVEDPVSSIEELKKIRSSLLVPVAADALIQDRVDIDNAILEGGVSYIVLKPPLWGGIGAVLDLSNRASRLGASTVLSSTYDGAVGLHSWCHLAAAISPDNTHGLGTAQLIDDRRMDALTPRNGIIELQG